MSSPPIDVACCRTEYAILSPTTLRLDVVWERSIPRAPIDYLVYAPHSNDLMALRSCEIIEVVHSERVGGFDDDDARIAFLHARTCEVHETGTGCDVAFLYQVPVLHARAPELPVPQEYVEQDLAVHAAMLRVIAALSDDTYQLTYDAWRSCASELGVADAEPDEPTLVRPLRASLLAHLTGFLELTPEVPKILMLLLLADIEASRRLLGTGVGGIEVLFEAAEEHEATAFAPLLRGQRRELAALLHWLGARNEDRAMEATHELIHLALEGRTRREEAERPRTLPRLRVLKRRQLAFRRRAHRPLLNIFGAYEQLAGGEVDVGLGTLLEGAWNATHSERNEEQEHEFVAATRAVPGLLEVYHELLDAVGCREQPNATEASFASQVALELEAPEKLLTRVATALSAGLRTLAAGGPHSQARADHRRATLSLAAAPWTLSAVEVLSALQLSGFLDCDEVDQLSSTLHAHMPSIALGPFFGGRTSEPESTEAATQPERPMANELRWALVWCDQPAGIAELERLWRGTQAAAVDDLIENTCWGESLPNYVGQRGEAGERRRALQQCFLHDARALVSTCRQPGHADAPRAATDRGAAP